MKLKAARSLLVLPLAIILVIGATTMAWFTAESNIPSAAEMVVGTLEFEITDASAFSNEGEQLEEGNMEWEAGSSKELRWAFKNTGLKTVFFRARPDCEQTCLLQDGSENAENECQIEWSLPDGSTWEEGRDTNGNFDGWYYYYCQPVPTDEEVTLALIGSMAEDSQDGTCNIGLQGEAVQASHNAANKEWAGYPGP